MENEMDRQKYVLVLFDRKMNRQVCLFLKSKSDFGRLMIKMNNNSNYEIDNVLLLNGYIEYDEFMTNLSKQNNDLNFGV